MNRIYITIFSFWFIHIHGLVAFLTVFSPNIDRYTAATCSQRAKRNWKVSYFFSSHTRLIFHQKCTPRAQGELAAVGISVPIHEVPYLIDLAFKAHRLIIYCVEMFHYFAAVKSCWKRSLICSLQSPPSFSSWTIHSSPLIRWIIPWRFFMWLTRRRRKPIVIYRSSCVKYKWLEFGCWRLSTCITSTTHNYDWSEGAV